MTGQDVVRTDTTHPDVPGGESEQMTGSISGPYWWAMLESATKEDAEDNVTTCLATNSTTPPEILTQLSQHTYSSIRGAVASNPNTPPTALHRLARDRRAAVRICVAHRGDLDPDDYLTLARDQNPDVICALAENTAIGEDTVAVLLTTDARDVVLANPTCPSHHLQTVKQRPGLDELLAANPGTPVRTLRHYRRLHYGRLDAALVRNPNLPAKLLEQLYDDNLVQQGSILRHPNCPRSLMERALDEDGIPWSSAGGPADLIDNPNLPDDLAQRLWDSRPQHCFDLVSNRRCPTAMLAAGCIHGDERIRRQAATNPNLTAAQLTQLARDPDENVRRLAWTHTNAGQEQLFSAPLPYLLGLSHIPSYRFDALARDTVQVALAFCRDGWSDTLGALIDTARMLTT